MCRPPAAPATAPGPRTRITPTIDGVLESRRLVFPEHESRGFRIADVVVVDRVGEAADAYTIGTVPYLKLYTWFSPHGSNHDGLRKGSAALRSDEPALR